MIYCDTSLVTVLTREPSTPEAQRWLSEHEPAGLCASLWVETEVASSLAMKKRAGLLSPAQQTAAFANWRSLRRSWRVLPVEAGHFISAAELTRAGPRAGDALHLALVLDSAVELATRDRDQALAAMTMGVIAHLVA